MTVTANGDADADADTAGCADGVGKDINDDEVSYGYQTWEWRNALRGYLYPSVFTVLYKVLHILRLDYRILLIKAPRVLQGLLAATGDFYLYKLSLRLSGTATAQWTLVCEILSWFLLYTYPRTLTNGAETALTVIALYHYPWPKLKPKDRNSTLKFLLVAGLSVIVRPTSVITWILLCGWHLQNSFSLRLCVLYVLAIGSCLTLSTLVDYLGYGKFVLVQYNFFKFNVVSNLGSHYGTHPWHWYVTQGYPVIIATHLVPFVAGVCKARNKSLFTVILWTLLIYSFLSHKEFRFVMHTIPLSMHYCGIYFHSLCTEDLQSNTKPHSSGKGHSFPSPENTSENASPDSEQKKKYFVQKSRLTKAYYLLIFLAVTNLPLAFYFNLIHQRGTVLVTKFLHDEFAPEKLTPTSRVLFLMPCHSTPFYSHIHRRVPMRFLTCEPNLSQTDHYVDEADLFFNDPLKWLDKEYNMTTSKKADTLPTHFVYY
ncbi:GPI mannosyltransferase 3, partial [Octopus bimaculoides]